MHKTKLYRLDFCVGEPSGLLKDLLAGNFAEALSRTEVRSWLCPKQTSSTSVLDYFRGVEQQIQNVAAADSLIQLQTAVASFLIFTQANLTG